MDSGSDQSSSDSEVEMDGRVSELEEKVCFPFIMILLHISKWSSLDALYFFQCFYLLLLLISSLHLHIPMKTMLSSLGC